MWLFFAFVPAIFDAGGNIIDGYLSNRFFKQPIILLFYIAIIELCLLPCFLLFQHPQVLHGPTLALFAIIGGLEIAYIAIYLLALLTDDTSVVVSMFSLGKVVVPLFAFFLVGEELTAQKYIAFFVIIVSTTLLTLHMESGRVRFNKSLWLMLSSSVLHGVEGVLYKVALEQVTWATGFAYTTLFSTVGLVILTLFQWRQIALHFSSFRSNLFIICSNAFLAFFSNMSGAIAL